MKFCFGIISYNNGDINRYNKLINLLTYLTQKGLNIDILLIAQCYNKNINCPNLIQFNYDKPLNIINARKELRKKFLEYNYDYIILLDDDVEFEDDFNWNNFLKALEENPKGFFFRRYTNTSHYLKAELSCCAISRPILEIEDFINVNPQNNEAYEDCVFANYLHFKYPQFEIIYTANFLKNRDAKSTWVNNKINRNILSENTRKLIKIIENTKEVPNLDVFFKRVAYKKPFKVKYDNKLKVCGKETKEEVLSLLKDNFVVNDKVQIGGCYLLPDGTFMWANDHSDFDKFLIEKEYYINEANKYYIGDGSQFLEELGCIRLRSRSINDKEFAYMPPFIIIRNKINSVQYDKLLEWLDFVRSTNNRLMLFINGKEKRYNDYIIDDVIIDIKKYFEKGVLL